MTENTTVKLSNELSRSNLKSLGFYMNPETKDFEIICQDNYYKYATKKVVICVSNDMSKIYSTIYTKDYDKSESCVSKNETTLHFNIRTTTELISLVRMITK